MFFVLKVGIAATIIAAQGTDFVRGLKTEIRLRALSASAEAEITTFGLYFVSFMNRYGTDNEIDVQPDGVQPVMPLPRRRSV